MRNLAQHHAVQRNCLSSSTHGIGQVVLYVFVNKTTFLKRVLNYFKIRTTLFRALFICFSMSTLL